MSPPVLSVVMPVRNRAELVGASLRSAQDEAGADTEIIVVDDGSSDGTAELLAGAARADARVQLLRTPQLGPAAARNAGVAAARGELLTFLDSDDLYPAGRVARQRGKLADRPHVAGVVGAVQFFDALDGERAPRADPRFLPFHNAVLQCATFRAAAFRRLGPLDETLAFAEDVDFFLRLLEADVPLVLEPDVACLYRVHAGNMTRDDAAKRQGYVQAYARSLARRRALGRTRPLESFFPGLIERETEVGGSHVLQALRLGAEPAGLQPYLDAFHLRPWRELTGLANLWLALDASGPGDVRVRRRRADGRVEVLHEVTLTSERRTLALDVEIAADGDDGVLELDADDGIELHSGGWTTLDPPRHHVRLAVVICSFNQPAAVLANLERLRGSGARLIVVHQGESELQAPADIDVMHQGNFGGSGGFTRGMLEALEGDATHVLLLDDDVEVPPDLIDRLRALIERVREPVTIGGQMLDRSAPTVLSASHEFVDLRRLRLRNPLKDTDLAHASARGLFAARHVSAYNGWWCCCIPAETLRVSLPLPLFVRQDDVEHGLHTTQSGREVVTMPGIFVWHEPFETKIKPWYAYYDQRNMLIVGALHGPASGPRMAASFLRDAGKALLAHRYDFCWAASQAVRDFLAGPAAVFADPRPRHEAIVSGVGRHLLRTIRGHKARGGRRETLRRALRRPQVRRPFAAAAGDILRCTIGLALGGSHAGAEFRAARDRYASPEFWRSYLELDG